MDIKTLTPDIAVVYANDVVITDGTAALELIANVMYATECQKLVIDSSLIDNSFFTLSTGFAGEVLQKFVNYRCKVAIVGDYSAFESGSMHDFIVESNRGRHVFFAESEAAAVQMLSRVD